MTSAMCNSDDYVYWLGTGFTAVLIVFNACQIGRANKMFRDARRLRDAAVFNHNAVTLPRALFDDLLRKADECNQWRDLWKNAKKMPQLPPSLTDCLKEPPQ